MQLSMLILACFVLLDFVSNANAGITSSYVRSEFPAVDMPIDAEVFAAPKGKNAPQQVRFMTCKLYIELNS